MNIRTDILLRVYATYLLLFVVAIAVVVQVFRIQTLEGRKWRQLSDSLSTEFVNVEAVRGNIYSSDGSLLATSLPEYELRMDLLTGALTNEIFNDKVDSLAVCLATLFSDKPAKEYERKLIAARKKGDRYFLLKRSVTYSQLKTIKTFPIFNMGRYKGGLLVIQKNKRIQPFKTLASRTIGYKVEGVRPVGLEGAFDSKLGGQSGKRLMQRIAGGVWMPLNDEDEIAPKDGYDIITTLDVNIQDVAQKALMEQLAKHNADHGCVVLMEVATGEVKAIANLTRIQPGVYAEKYNYAIGEATEPGSTFKLASFMAGLEDKKFDVNDSVNTDGGKVKYYNHILSDSHEGGYGRISMKKAFEVSSNVAISKMIYKGYRDNPEKFIQRLRQFKLDKPLGLEIPGEGMPRIKDTKSSDWSGLSLPQMSIGYEVKLTPLQTLTFYNAVANNGYIVTPRFVKEIQKMGQVVETHSAKVSKNKICSDETLAKVRKLMEGVVANGTAKNLSTTIYKIAGKTGTAQVAQGAQGYKNGKRTYQASFCGYFPAENPKYSIIVVVNDPSVSGYYGNVVAGPIFKEIADKIYAASLNIHKDIDQEYPQLTKNYPIAKPGYKEKTLTVYNKIGISTNVPTDAEWVSVAKKDHSINLSPKAISQGVIPDVIGMGLQDAIYLLENAGLKTIVRGTGKVINQSLTAGNRVIKGSTVVLNLQ